MKALGTSPAALRLAVALFLAASIAALTPPHLAYAWFNDVTESYPASQPLAISGNALTGNQIPEGVYSITASSSSYMCKLTDVTLTSTGGNLYATFTISKAYNALYLGTAEEAAAQTNEAGDDGSAYYIVDPFNGYVARRFTLPIPALNEEITLATFNGGNKGLEEGEWYTRSVSFNSSTAVENAIAGIVDADGPDDSPAGTSGPTAAGSLADTGQDGGNDTEPAQTPADSTTGADEASTDASGTASSSEHRTTPSGNGRQGSHASAGQSTGDSPAAAGASKSDATTTASLSGGTVAGKVGRAISLVGADGGTAYADLSAAHGGNAASDESSPAPSGALIACITALNIALAIACAFCAMRARPKRAGTDETCQTDASPNRQ